jgi:hypothetical protein
VAGGLGENFVPLIVRFLCEAFFRSQAKKTSTASLSLPIGAKMY